MGHIYSLEMRRLLSVTVTYDAAEQTLFCTGNERKDSVVFSRGQGTETLRALVDGQPQSFFEPIKLISISMGEGGDLVILGRTAIPTIVKGGKGPDTISGGLADETLMGDGGFDYIYGREGADIIVGGLQGDTIIGADGNDTLTAGSDLLDNDDKIFGGSGNDLVDYSGSAQPLLLQVGDLRSEPEPISDYIANDIETIRGTAGDDRIQNATSRGIVIEGLAGNDTLIGGSGQDTLVGGPGADSLMGTGGDDVFDAGDGAADIIDGGGGSDILQTTDDGLDVITTVP